MLTYSNRKGKRSIIDTIVYIFSLKIIKCAFLFRKFTRTYKQYYEGLFIQNFKKNINLYFFFRTCVYMWYKNHK